MVPLVDDDIHELDENFFATLSSNADPSILALAPASTTITILDDEGKKYDLLDAAYIQTGL